MKNYDSSMMKTAFIWSKESYCIRKQVGAVISKEGRIISIGYNGTISGLDNCCEEIIKYENKIIHIPCQQQDFEDLVELEKSIIIPFLKENNYHADTKVISKTSVAKDFKRMVEVRIKIPVLVTKKTVQHAERNAMDYAAKNGVSLDGCTMYVTLEPCVECAKSICSVGIKRVVFAENYRIKEGVPFLKESGIEVVQLLKENI